MRLFFALWPPRAAADALHAWATQVRRASGGRVTRPATIHLTLAFLGEVEETALPDLRNLRIEAEKLNLPIEQARYWAHNRIVWVGPKETPASLATLSKTLKEEKRPFAAHITLIRKARDPGPLPALPKIEWPVNEVMLVRSHLSSEGSSYEVLQRYPLG
ncbi:MAG: RNA 2',3'-cyclic phosphodiesterase [Pseudomonadota bacterium]